MKGTPQTCAAWFERLIAYRINPGIFFMAVLILSLNITDACFTQLIIEHGGWEINPIARAAMATFGDHFWVWKHVVVSLAVIMLISHWPHAHVEGVHCRGCLPVYRRKRLASDTDRLPLRRHLAASRQ